MKRFTHIFPLLLAILCMGCKQVKQYPVELLRIDSLTYVNPDSGYRLSLELKPRMVSAPEPERRYYELLTVALDDKLHHTPSSDSLILGVLDYYQTKHADIRLLPLAFYYAGRVTRQLGDAPQALDYLQQALDAVQTEQYRQIEIKEFCMPHSLESVLYSQIGYLLNSQQLHEEAIESFKHSYEVKKMQADTVGMITSLCDLGYSFQAEDNDSEALFYFADAEQLARETNDTIHLNTISYNEALSLIYLNRYDDAQAKLSEVSEALIPTSHISRYYQTKAYFYSETGRKDSAQYFYNKLLTIEFDDIRQQARLWLANQAVNQGRPDEAIEYLRQYITETNEVSKNSNAEATALAHSLYNYQLREKENTRLKLHNAKSRISLTIAGSTAILLIVVLLFVLKIQSQKREKAQQQFLHLQLQQKQRELESEQTLQKNALRIQELEAKINATSSEKDKVQKELEALKLANQHAELGIQRNQIFRQMLDVSPVTFMINKRELEHEILSSEDWEDIEGFFKANNPDFVSALLSLHSFTTIEWHVTLLVKLGLNPKSIGTLIPTSQSSVSSIRRRLFEKIFDKKGNSSDWDNFIRNL